METIFDDIERALAAQIYFAAVAVALSVPDICASLQHPVGHIKGSNKSGYMRWVNDNLAEVYPELVPADLYSLRSGTIHSGRFGGGSYGRVIFTIPDGRGNVLHRCTIRDAYNLDAVTFCRDMIAAGRGWLVRQDSDRNVQRNLMKVVQMRPAGLSPYIQGMPVIA